jgi:monoamine oxidase
MTITRRGLLASSAAATLMRPFRAGAAPLPREADIVVIGAGAAGIAAARRVLAAKRSVIVIEAADRIGGRCATDTATFGVPFDRGARWLYNPDSNALGKLARTAGIDLYTAPQGQKIRIGRRNARAGETEEFLATLVRANRAIDDASRGRTDVAAAAALPKDLGDWRGTTEFVLGPNATGKDMRDLSAMERARAMERMSPLATRQGLGTLLGKLAEDVPVSLSTPATRIVWGGREVSVETPAGKISARCAIVTASSNVLASGVMKFSPDLPRKHLEAAVKLSLGSQDRIALMLAGNPLGLGRDDAFIEQSKDARTGFLCANIGASSLCTVDVSGSFGRELSEHGQSAMIAFATEWLTGLFGSEFGKSVRKSAATQWNADPNIQGAMSAAMPGSTGARRALMDSFAGVFLAGEAAHETLWGSVDGAWESGERAAIGALKRIGAIRETETDQPAKRPLRERLRGKPAPSADAASPPSTGSVFDPSR